MNSKEWRWLMLIMLLGAGLRLSGLNFGLPYIFQADEPRAMHHALSYSAGDFNPHYFWLPPLLSYVLFFLFGLYFLVLRGLGFIGSVAQFGELFLRDPSSFYLIGRMAIGVLLGVASIYLVYRIASLYWSRRVALLSAAIMAVLFLHVRESHFIYHDVPLVFFLLLAQYALSRFLMTARTRALLLSGLFTGIAAGWKYNGALFVLPIVGTVMAVHGPKFWRAFFDKRLYIVGIVTLGAFLLTCPFPILSPGEFFHDLKAIGSVQGSLGFFYHFFHSLKEGAGYLLVFMALFQLLRIREKKFFLLWLFPLLWYFYLSRATQVYSRYVLAILPYLALFAAATADDVARRVTRLRPCWMRPLWLCLCAAMILPNLYKSFALDLLLIRKDVRVEAKEWIEKHIPEGSKIAINHTFFGPPLVHSRERLHQWLGEVEEQGRSPLLKRKLEFMLQQMQPGYELYYLREFGDAGERSFFTAPSASYDWAALEQMGIGYLIISYPDSREFSSTPLADFYDRIEEKSTLLMRFSPYRSKKRLRPIGPEGMTGAPLYTREILSRRTNGYTIDIYEISK